jgi:hypothetical protein
MTQIVLDKEAIAFDRSIAFFETVKQSYQKASQSYDCKYAKYFRIANQLVCLQFVGEALTQRMTRSIAHLEVPLELLPEDSKPDLTICLISEQETGFSRPAAIWEGYQWQRRGEIRGLVNDQIYTSIQWNSEALVILDKLNNLAFYWVENHDRILHCEVAAPFQALFNVWFGQRQVQLVHAATVGWESGGVLLVGKSGSGKSTTALSCLDSPLQYLSDDYSLVTPDPTPTAFSLYSTGKKNADDLERLSFLRSCMSNPDRLDREKAVYFIQELFPEKILRLCPLKATLIPRVTGQRETTLEPTLPQTGLAALVPSTIRQLGGAGKIACDLMSQTILSMPCYFLNVGTDIPQIAQVIQDFLREANHDPA